MDPKHLLLAHGEKVVVLVVAGVCAWTVIGAFTGSDIRPKDVTAQSIDERIVEIERRMDSQEAPGLAPVPPYLSDMKKRFSRELPRPVRLSWLLNHPDIGGVPRGVFFYIYEVNQPQVTARDNVGKIELVVQVPGGGRGSDRRSSATEERGWVRTTERTIVNTGQVVGLIVEMAVGQNAFKPLKAPGVLEGGFIPLETLRRTQGKFTWKADALWQPHLFRARTVVKATGFTGENENADDTVLVHEGAHEEPADWVSDLYDNGWKTDPDAFMQRYLKPAKLAIPGVQLGKGEKLYIGAMSDPPAEIVVTADIRFAFDKPANDPNDPAKELGAFLVSKQFVDKGNSVWLEKPQQFKPAKGEVLGAPVDLVPPGGIDKIPVDLTTPFEVAGFERDVSRIWYYEISTKPREDGKKGKEFVIKPKEVKTEVAVLINSKTGEKVKLPKLQEIRPPSRKDAIYWPQLPGHETYDEEAEFKKSPAHFVQRELVPQEPVLHDPDKGPLLDLHAEGNALAATDTKYVELPDGRLIWWEPRNGKIRQHPEPAASAAPAGGGVAPKPPAAVRPPANRPPPRPTRPGGQQPPAGQPPQDVPPQGMPPPGMPQGGPPPGVLPPGVNPDGSRR